MDRLWVRLGFNLVQQCSKQVLVTREWFLSWSKPCAARSCASLEPLPSDMMKNGQMMFEVMFESDPQNTLDPKTAWLGSCRRFELKLHRFSNQVLWFWLPAWFVLPKNGSDLLRLQPLGTTMSDLKLVQWNLHFAVGRLRCCLQTRNHGPDFFWICLVCFTRIVVRFTFWNGSSKKAQTRGQEELEVLTLSDLVLRSIPLFCTHYKQCSGSSSSTDLSFHHVAILTFPGQGENQSIDDR